MKKIEAFIKPFTLETVKEALHEADIQVFRILKAQELSGVPTHTEVYRGTEYELDMAPRVLIVVLVEEELVQKVVECLRGAAGTDNPGDGEIVVTTVDRVVPIDTPGKGDRVQESVDKKKEATARL
jgi:nitrogen regulatory protein PII